eukprot:569278_1
MSFRKSCFTMDDSDHWVPFDEDENSSMDSDLMLSLGNGHRAASRTMDLISSACIIDAEYRSIEIHGADLNTKLTCALFEQIHDRLIQITNNKPRIPISANNVSLFDIKDVLSEMTQTLISFQLIYVAMTSATLSLLSNIIRLCSPSLRDLELELFILLEQHANHDELIVTGLFHQIMRQCSLLPALEAIGIDLINFPLECYKYFDYFDVLHHFASLKTLRVFICKENSKDASIHRLLDFIEHHQHLEAIRLIVNDIEDDGIWDDIISINHQNTKRFELFQQDVDAFNTMCFLIIGALNKSVARCNALKAFSFCHYLSDDIHEYMNILSQFVAKHRMLSEISIAFNCLSDACLSQLLRVMHETEALMHHLEYVELDSTKLHDLIQRDDTNNNLNDDTNIKAKHFGRDSVFELAKLITKCDGLIGLEMKCFDGMDVTAFAALTRSIIGNRTLSKITLNNLQRTHAIFDGLRRIFCGKEYSFLCGLSVKFNRHYLDALRREKYTIPESFYQSLNNSSAESLHDSYDESEREIEKQLRPNCDVNDVMSFVDSIIESQCNLLRYIDGLKRCLSGCKHTRFPTDVVRIIVDYVVLNSMDEEENILNISLQSLPNDIKSKSIQHFVKMYQEKHIKWKDKVQRIIKINSCSSLKLMNDACVEYEDDFDPID